MGNDGGGAILQIISPLAFVSPNVASMASAELDLRTVSDDSVVEEDVEVHLAVLACAAASASCCLPFFSVRAGLGVRRVPRIFTSGGRVSRVQSIWARLASSSRARTTRARVDLRWAARLWISLLRKHAFVSRERRRTEACDDEQPPCHPLTSI